MGDRILLNVGGHQEVSEKVRPKYKWTVTDIDPNAEVVVDISNSQLPFGDKSVDAIYSSHTLEHIDIGRLSFVFSEFYRVLKREAKLRVVVPDWDIAIKAYNKQDFRFLERTKVVADERIFPNIPLINLFSWAYSYHFSEGKKVVVHKTPFNKDVLYHFLKQSLFVDIQLKSCNDCSEVFTGLDLDIHKECSLYMEASTS